MNARAAIVLAGKLLRFALAVALLAALTACSTTQSTSTQLNDAGIEAAVKTKIAADPDTNPFEISVEVNEGVVYLRGTVDDREDRGEAERLARSVEGVRRVENDIRFGDETVGEMLDDASITARVNAKLTADDELSPFDIDVTTEQGVVYLTGRVPDSAERRKAEELARSVEGVRRVVNQLAVGEIGS